MLDRRVLALSAMAAAACSNSTTVLAPGSSGVNSRGGAASDLTTSGGSPGLTPVCTETLDTDEIPLEAGAPAPTESNNADSGDGCAAGAWFSPDYFLFLSAQRVTLALGATVRFVRIDPIERGVLAEMGDTHEAIFVRVVSTACARSRIEVHRLPEGFRDWSLHPGLLACSDAQCALLRITDSNPETLTFVPGASVPESFIGTLAAPVLGLGTCVVNGGPQAWCFDGTRWTASDYQTIAPHLSSQAAMGTSGTRDCAGPAGYSGTLRFWAPTIDGMPSSPGAGVSEDGQVVAGSEPNAAPCCHALTPPLGKPIDFALSLCGILSNWALLTEDTYFGTLNCGID